MKTKKVRPVFILSNPNNETSGGVFNEKDRNWYNIYLISLDTNEKIEDGDLHIRYHNGRTGTSIGNTPIEWCHKYKYKKIIATQDQLSPEYIHQFIKEYNSGEVKDLEIEMTAKDCLSSHEGNTIWEPLLVNGFVTIVEKEKSTREQAMEWWNEQDQDCKMELCIQYNDICNLQSRIPSSLTGREIESIWRQELQEDLVSDAMAIHHQKLLESSSFAQKVYNELIEDGSNNPDNKELVDFELLNKFTNDFLKLLDQEGKVYKNTKLFFQKLSESSSFAHKAHKELQRLNK